MKKILILFFLCCCIQQDYYLQENYFQQEVNTTIDVSLNDKKHELSAFETIEYFNHSNAGLDSILFHLWPNAYKNINTALAKHDLENGEVDFRFSASNEKGFIDSLDFRSSNQQLNWTFYKNHIDIAVVYLKKTLLPGEKITITTPFKVKIPLGIFSRLGHIGDSYQITQWFPKPAVYDKDGWHPLPYLSQGEFYSEFGTYDVKITLPENYVLGATGDLVNGENELKFLMTKVNQTKQLMANPDSIKDGLTFPKSSKKTKTLHFHQENVHDFAWFADKRYHVLKGEVELPYSKRKVDTWAMFTNNEFDLWQNAIEYINAATYNYSLWVGEYPYNHVTAVDGSISAGGGMEYPNITVIGESYNDYSHDLVITHEVGHNWFYGILGSNERENAWMDEGINSFFENRHMESRYPLKNSTNNTLLNSLNLNGKSMMQLGYQFNASRNNDQPIQMGANKYSSMNYGVIVYGKTGIGFNYLKEYLGDSIFDSAMKMYYQNWKFKHPQPKDLEKTFNNSSTKNLSWFFDDFIKSTKKIDYKIQHVSRKNATTYHIKLKNKTGFPAPIAVTGINNKDSTITFSKWITGFKKDTLFTIKTKEELSNFQLNYNNISTDINTSNNFSRTKGLFKKVAPIKLKLLAGIENPSNTNIYFSPLLGWNNYDRLMPGIAVYNSLILEKKLEWGIHPMYSTSNKSLVGTGSINYQLYPEKLFSRVSIGYSLNTFFHQPVVANDRWMRNELFAHFKFKSKNIRTSAAQSIQIKTIRIDENIFSGNFTYPLESFPQTSYFNVIEYQLKNKQFLTPKGVNIKYIQGFRQDQALVSSLQLTANYRINYNKKLNGFELRFFGGYNFFSSSSRYNFLMRGQDGYNDYLYERTYLGRNTGFPNMLFQQSSNSHGAFKINTAIGRPEKWLIATNLKLEIPKVPIGLFSDLGVFPNYEVFYNPSTGSTEESKTIEPMLNAGFYFSIKANNKAFLSVYFPLLYSQNIKTSAVYSAVNSIKDLDFLQKITFVIALDNINPRNLIKDFGP